MCTNILRSGIARNMTVSEWTFARSRKRAICRAHRWSEVKPGSYVSSSCRNTRYVLVIRAPGDCASVALSLPSGGIVLRGAYYVMRENASAIRRGRVEKDERRPEMHRERKRERGDPSIGMCRDQYRAKRFGRLRVLEFKSNPHENT